MNQPELTQPSPDRPVATQSAASQPGPGAGATDMAGRIKLVKVNVDDSPRLQQRFGVQSIPTLLVLRRGEVISRQIGAVPEPAIKNWVNQALQQA